MPSIAEFVKKKATSKIGSCPNYFVLCLLATTAYFTAEAPSYVANKRCHATCFQSAPPRKGKFQALKEDWKMKKTFQTQSLKSSLQLPLAKQWPTMRRRSLFVQAV